MLRLRRFGGCKRRSVARLILRNSTCAADRSTATISLPGNAAGQLDRDPAEPRSDIPDRALAQTSKTAKHERTYVLMSQENRAGVRSDEGVIGQFIEDARTLDRVSLRGSGC